MSASRPPQQEVPRSSSLYGHSMPYLASDVSGNAITREEATVQHMHTLEHVRRKDRHIVVRHSLRQACRCPDTQLVWLQLTR